MIAVEVSPSRVSPRRSRRKSTGVGSKTKTEESAVGILKKNGENLVNVNDLAEKKDKPSEENTDAEEEVKSKEVPANLQVIEHTPPI